MNNQKAKTYLKNGGKAENIPLKTRLEIAEEAAGIKTLSEKDAQAINEVLDEDAKEVNKPMSTELPEAPMSISTTAYYKGFSMMITKRDPEVKVLPLIESQMKMIDFLIEQGCKPSWNDDTNTKHSGNGYAARQPAAKVVNTADCTHEHKADKQSSGHNKPENKGRRYVSCMDCKKFIGWKDENMTREPVAF